MVTRKAKRKTAGNLYLWVLVAILIGVAIGHFAPDVGVTLKPLGDGFISLTKMVIAPIICVTVVLGISGVSDVKKVGRAVVKAILYFEVVSTLVLGIGLLVVNALKSGSEFNPREKGQPITAWLEAVSQVLFRMTTTFIRLAPIGAGGGMAFMIGKYGVDSLGSLLKLTGGLYLTCFLFVIIMLSLTVRFLDFSIFKFIRYIREGLLPVLSTSSSKSALVPLMGRM